MGVDWSLAHSLNGFLFRHDAVEDPLLVYVQAAEALFFGMLLLVCALARHERWRGTRRAAVAAGLSAGLALLVDKVISSLYYRARPFVTHPHAVHLFAAHVRDSSFPSDHAAAAIAIGIAILLRRKLGWGLVTLVFAIVLMFGRVALGFHYPSDVLAGAGIGLACAFVLWMPPLRRLIDAISDRVGGLWDRALDTVIGALAPRGLARPR